MLQAEILLLSPITDIQFVAYIPLFPLAMIGGIVLQFILTKTGRQHYVHSPTIAFVGGLALEVVIITAIATMSVSAITSNMAPIVLIALTGTLWNIGVFLWLAPRLMGKYWFERGIGDYGQSMGMTATGILLMKLADPKNRSHALERFGYKQLLFEPVVGGGVFTAVSMIIIAEFGLTTLLVISTAVLLFWYIIGRLSFYEPRP
jgi:glutamate:Na+ symporter, ESS family